MSLTHDPRHVSSSSAEVSLRERLLTLNVTSSAEATALAKQGQQATYLALAWAPFFAFVRVFTKHIENGEWFVKTRTMALVKTRTMALVKTRTVALVKTRTMPEDKQKRTI